MNKNALFISSDTAHRVGKSVSKHIPNVEVYVSAWYKRGNLEGYCIRIVTNGETSIMSEDMAKLYVSEGKW